jgi:hypothetical protein
MGIECVRVPVLYGVDDVVQDFWDAGQFPFDTQTKVGQSGSARRRQPRPNAGVE